MEPTAEFAQLQLRFVDQIQWRYEVIRPLVLCADPTVQQRVQEIRTHPETVRQLRRSSHKRDMRGLLPNDVQAALALHSDVQHDGTPGAPQGSAAPPNCVCGLGNRPGSNVPSGSISQSLLACPFPPDDQSVWLCDLAQLPLPRRGGVTSDQSFQPSALHLSPAQQLLLFEVVFAG